MAHKKWTPQWWIEEVGMWAFVVALILFIAYVEAFA